MLASTDADLPLVVPSRVGRRQWQPFAARKWQQFRTSHRQRTSPGRHHQPSRVRLMAHACGAHEGICHVEALPTMHHPSAQARPSRHIGSGREVQRYTFCRSAASRSAQCPNVAPGHSGGRVVAKRHLGAGRSVLFIIAAVTGPLCAAQSAPWRARV